MDWKQDSTILFNRRSSVELHYRFSHDQKPTQKLLDYWNTLPYDTLCKIDKHYRDQWIYRRFQQKMETK